MTAPPGAVAGSSGSSRTLDRLDDVERYERFDRLQAAMRGVWDIMRLNLEGESVVVVPSVTVDRVGARSGAMTQAYEERFLFLLLLLRQPRLRMVYITSMPVQPTIVEYYLALLPGVIPSHARGRLHLVAVGDSSPTPLSEKLLARPRLLRRIGELIPDRARCHLLPYNTTPMERDIAIQLGIPMYGADPRLFEWGTKTGCRRLFAEEGVQHPLGAEALHTVDDVAAALATMRTARSGMSRAIVKLNEGVSGAGNAMVDLSGMSPPGSPDEHVALRDRVLAMRFEQPDMLREGYLAKLAERGGIVEELVAGADVRSPSVQLRVLPSGEVELLSTHDQLLGGPSGQSYLGARFPADIAYARSISAEAKVVGDRLAREGVLGRFAIDFVVVRRLTGSGTRTQSSSTSGRAARPTPSSRSSSSPTVATTRTPACSSLPAPQRSTWSPQTTSSHRFFAASAWTTCSTSWPATGCTSTSHARPAS